ncbi:MAG: hypothetical protein ABSB89_05950 [Candidatus Bathyarchaeia archaeon]|jgi:hypothetical protein
MVEKRTLVFAMLATIVWASLASAFVGYYYLENTNNSGQLNSANNSLDTVASSYSNATNKYDLLLSEYGTLYGNYSYFTGNNYLTLMPPLRSLISEFSKNYSDLFVQQDINNTYNQLLSDYEILLQNGNVTKTDFGNLLSEYYDLFNLSAFRELGLSVSEATTLSVSIEINYGNQTLQWDNETRVPAGYTLFMITQKVAVIKYSYDPFAQPGHVFVDSINDKADYTNSNYTAGYSWIWYYSSDGGKTWVSGPVGCDAWLLTNGSAYKWNYESWSYQ